MLQNRVDPSGNIISTSARGAWMGNRGLIHNEHQQIIRPFKLKAWLICVLEFKNRKRKVMTPNLYTELFFLDEATAFSAGHRPCFECRRQDATRFKQCWIKGNPEYGFSEKTHIGNIDMLLHDERIDRSMRKISFHSSPAQLPEGAFILLDNVPHLIAREKAWIWTPFGYKDGILLKDIKLQQVEVLTPRSVIKAFKAGYLPQMSINHN